MFSRFHAANAHDQALKLYHLSVDWSVRLSFPFFAFIAIYAESLLSYFGAEFAIAGEAALLVLLASATLNSLTGPLGIFMNMWGGETILLRIGVVHEVILVAAYIFLIPRFGLVGAASANLAAMGYSAIAGYLAARKHAGVCWFDRRYLRWPLPMLAFATLCFYFRDARWVVPGIVNLVGIFAGLFVMFHAMFLLYGLHEDDRVLVSAIREKAAAVRGSLAALLYRRP